MQMELGAGWQRAWRPWDKAHTRRVGAAVLASWDCRPHDVAPAPSSVPVGLWEGSFSLGTSDGHGIGGFS
jgi:hypothetical protein